MRRHAITIALCVSTGHGCADCTQNAVVVAEQVQRLAPIVDTIEVFQDSDGDGAFSLEERVFVVDPRAAVPKIIRVSFLIPVPREALRFDPDPQDGQDGFIVFNALPPLDIAVTRTYFDDDPTDTNPAGPPASAVTYALEDDLTDPAIGIHIGVAVNLALDRIDEMFEPARFAFVVAKPSTLPGPPPRIVSFTPAATSLPGWGRPIELSDFGPGETLADVLARVDQNLLGATLSERPAPHQPLAVTFDDEMSNLVVSITPSGPSGSPGGLVFRAPTLGFVTPFVTAKSDTSIGMIPDATYEVTALSNWSVVRAPVVTGTQNVFGQFLIPNFSDELYESLITQGYTERDLAGESRYRIRVGPFRIRSPEHHGETNATTAPQGQLIAELQFAVPAEGIASPTTIEVITTADSSVTTMVVPFLGGTPDVIVQDGVVRSSNVTRHPVALQLPPADYDDLLSIEMRVLGPAPEQAFLGFDRIEIHHDVVVPEIADGSVEIENTYQDGSLDQLCVVADCDVERFIVQVAGGQTVEVSAGTAAPSTCVGGVRQYCFDQVSLGIPGGAEGEVTVTIVAVDDQGNQSAPVVVTTAPPCQLFDKFVGNGGRRLAAISLATGDTGVAWDDGANLRYAERALGGTWSRRAGIIYTLPAGHTFGLGIDMVLEPVVQRPMVCLVDAEVPEGQSTAA